MNLTAVAGRAVPLHRCKELASPGVCKRGGIELPDEAAVPHPVSAAFASRVDVTRIPPVRPTRRDHRPRQGLKPDESAHPVGRVAASMATPRSPEAREDRALLAGGVEHREEVGGARLQVRGPTHVVGEPRAPPIVQVTRALDAKTTTLGRPARNP